MDRKTARMQISLERQLQERIDNYSKKRNITRSALIAQACSQYLDAQERMPDLMVELDKMKKAIEELQKDAKTL